MNSTQTGRERDRKIVDYVDTAVNFLEAADRLLKPNQFDVHMYMPCGFLISHAAELTLIAFLRIEGRKGGQSGHDLVRLLAAAKEAGMRARPGFEAFVEAQNQAHKGYSFRYPDFTNLTFVDPSRGAQLVRGQAIEVRQHGLQLFQARWK